MPVNVAMHEPRAGVVRREPEGNVVAGTTNTHDITAYRVGVIVFAAAGDTDDIKVVTVKMDRVLS